MTAPRRDIDLRRLVRSRADSIAEVHAGRRPEAGDDAVLERNFRAAYADMEMDAVAVAWFAAGGPGGVSVAEMGGAEPPAAAIDGSAARVRAHLGRLDGVEASGEALADLESRIAHELYYLLTRRLEGVAGAAEAAGTEEDAR